MTNKTKAAQGSEYCDVSDDEVYVGPTLPAARCSCCRQPVQYVMGTMCEACFTEWNASGLAWSVYHARKRREVLVTEGSS